MNRTRHVGSRRRQGAARVRRAHRRRQVQRQEARPRHGRLQSRGQEIIAERRRRRRRGRDGGRRRRRSRPSRRRVRKRPRACSLDQIQIEEIQKRKGVRRKGRRRLERTRRRPSTSSDGEGDIDVFGGSASKKSDDATGEKGEKRRRKSALQEAADDATGDKGPRSALEEAANVLRKRHKIRVAGAVNSCPPPLESFDDLRTKHGLGRKMLERLVEAGFETPTPIQRQAIPILLEGSELLAVAPTGSGKTLAFLLPMVTRLRGKDDAAGGPRALLLSPTKELAQQSFRILKLLCRGTNSLRCVQGICSHASPTSFVFLGASLRLRCAIGGDATFGWWRD